MSKIKEIWKNNKKGIIVGTVVGVTAVIATSRYYKSAYHVVPKTLQCITWKPKGRFISLEGAKAALDLNSNNSSTFAIVKDGSNYIGLILDGGNGFVQP